MLMKCMTTNINYIHSLSDKGHERSINILFRLCCNIIHIKEISNVSLFLIYLRSTDHEMLYPGEFCQRGLPPQSWEERRQMSTLQIPNNIGSQLFCQAKLQKTEMWRTLIQVQYSWVIFPITDDVKHLFVFRGTN